MDSLDTLLTGLQLQPPEHSTLPTGRFDNFTLFPTLPAELRLKVMFHTLPTPTTLKLAAHVIVADPTFGLYLSFAPAPPSPSQTSSFLSPSASKLESLASTRQKPLLLVNKTFRSFYLSHFPLSLPIGPRGVGQLRYAPSETIFISNLDSLIQDHDFGLAIKEGFRLQNWWEEVEIIGVPVTALGLGPNRGNGVEVKTVFVVKKCKKVKEVRVHMWEGFEDKAAEMAMRASIQREVSALRREIEGIVEEMGGEGDWAVPNVVLV